MPRELHIEGLKLECLPNLNAAYWSSSLVMIWWTLSANVVISSPTAGF